MANLSRLPPPQASRDDQTQAWKKYRPKKGERVSWWDFARALDKRRMWARDAKFAPNAGLAARTHCGGSSPCG
jgi:hypothetical protein